MERGTCRSPTRQNHQVKVENTKHTLKGWNQHRTWWGRVDSLLCAGPPSWPAPLPLTPPSSPFIPLESSATPACRPASPVVLLLLALSTTLEPSQTTTRPRQKINVPCNPCIMHSHFVQRTNERIAVKFTCPDSLRLPHFTTLTGPCVSTALDFVHLWSLLPLWEPLSPPPCTQ